MHRGDGWLPPPTQPRALAGGIRAQSRSGPIGERWWSRRWLAAIEAAAPIDRLERGREYARTGQVASLQLGLGAIVARVQGTRTKPYDVQIELRQFDQLAWLQIAQRLARTVHHRAELLAGRMPDDVEAVVGRAGETLFPSLEDGDLRMRCTCADWMQPCRHVAAVCFLAAEAFDQDPFQLLRLRGIEPDVLLALLLGSDSVHATPAGDAPDSARSGRSDAEIEGRSPRLDANEFWQGVTPATGTVAGGADGPSDVVQTALAAEPPPVDAPLIRVLGPLTPWRGADDLVPALRRVFARVAADPRLADLLLGGSGERRRPR